MIELLNIAWLADCETPADKLVLVHLCDRANKQKRAWPSIPSIARACGMSDRGVELCLKRIETSGHMTVTRKDGSRNRYLMHPRVVTPEPRSGANGVRGTTEESSPLPPNSVRPTHERRSPTSEPPLTTNRTIRGTVPPLPSQLPGLIKEQKKAISECDPSDSESLDAFWKRLWEYETQHYGAPKTKRKPPQAKKPDQEKRKTIHETMTDEQRAEKARQLREAVNQIGKESL